MNHTLLYQVNTRIILHELGRELGRAATFDDLPDARLDEAAARGFTWIWLLGAWQTGDAGRRVARALPEQRAAYARELPDVRDDDVDGSPFAVRAYQPAAEFGGEEALARLRARMIARGLRLMLDFVPNHLATDHPWVTERPEFLVAGSEEDLAREPQSFGRFGGGGGAGGGRVLAHGRDPFFPAWSDTVQVNYRHAGARQAITGELTRIARWCDGVRCDMAMLLQPDVFLKTWGDRALPSDGTPPVDLPFWPEAIRAVRRDRPDFLFVAEVYWDREWELQQAGFDFTYDKRLYDRLRAGAALPVREHLRAAPEFQDRSLRFLENHDEPRAAAVFAPEVHRAAAVVTFLVPGMHLIQEGQLEGRKVRLSVHLGRRALELVDAELAAFYGRLLPCLRRPEVGRGQWRLLDTTPAWDGSASGEGFIVTSWCAAERRLVTAVNFAPTRGQCYARLDLPGIEGRPIDLVDLMGEARYQRDGSALARGGLYLDLPAWGYYVFDVRSG